MKSRSSMLVVFVILLTLMLCRPAFVVSAADITSLPASGTWPAGTLTESFGVDVTNGPLVKGTIIIPSGITLTLTNNASTLDHVTLNVDASFAGDCIFKVESGGKLVIKGASYSKYFGIRGGTKNLVAVDANGVRVANRSTKMAQLANPNGGSYPDLKNGAICNSGTLVLENVRIFDVQSSSNGAIYIPRDDYKKHGTTTLKGCWLHRIKAVRGAAVMVDAQVSLDSDGNVISGTDNTATSCAVSMDNVQIFQCHVTGDESGQSGCIRTYGNCASNINLKDVEFSQNKSDGDGCAIYWNGHGRPDTKMTFDNCKIYNNHSAEDGGALHLEGSFEFVNNLTEIYKNSAGNEGGAIFIKLYGSEQNQVRTDLMMSFNQFVSIHDNESVSNGGGVAISFSNTSLPAESTITVSLNGANIKNNTTSESGGGVYLWTNLSKDKNIGLNFNVSGNTVVSDNTASKNGGGIYCRRSTDQSQVVNVTFDSGTISNNTGNNGGGAYIERMDVECTEAATGLEFNGNIARYNGGALHVNMGSFLMRESTITSNKAYGEDSNGYGGGVYVRGGGSFTIYDGMISSNTTKVRGGGVGVADGAVTISGGTISSNKAGVSNTGTEIAGGIGGGIHVSGGGNIKITNGAISGNHATQDGGAVYSDGGMVTISAGEISSNTAVQYGGGIHVSGGGNIIITDGNLSSNEASKNGGGIYSDGGEVSISNGNITSNKVTASDGDGGGLYVLGGNVTITGGLIKGNKAPSDGAGIYVSDGNVTMSGGTLEQNEASSHGGGVYMVGGGFKMTGGSFISNRCNGRGGGLYSHGSKIEIEGGTFQSNWAALTEAGLALENIDGGAIYHRTETVESGSNYSMILRGGVFKDNKADRGGAIRIDYANVLFDRLNGAEVEMSENWADNTGACIAIYSGGSMTVNGGKFKNNVSANTAGVIHINSSGGSVTMNDGLFDGNSATTFGGVINMTAGTLTVNGGTYTNNECINSQSGNGSGGAIYLRYPASCNIVGGRFESNTASNFGGAMYLSGCQCSVSGGSIIGNSATVAGGGIALRMYEDNALTYNGSLTIQGGVIQDNTAKRGGGFFVVSSSVTMTEGSITDNRAINGGGLFISGGAQMTFSDGFIANNRALVNLSSNGSNAVGTTTAYAPFDNLYGVGGGVFLGSGTSGNVTTLTFGSADEGEFGLYNNLAETVADDIYAYGQYTSITLPDISRMSLKGYSSRTSELYWVEDFMTGDTAYHEYGTNINTSSSYSPIRYRDAIAAQTTVYKVVTTDPITKYVALSLGHEIIYITLQKTGLKAGESAIFRVFRVDNGVSSVYSEVLLTGKDGQDVQSKRVALYSGTWKITEIPWTWSYDIEPVSYERNITGTTAAEDKIFVFTGVKKVSAPLHAEDIVTNDFGEGTATTGSYVDSAVISDLQRTTDYQLK